MTKTYVAKPGTFKQNWVSIDAKGLVLGRLATQIAIRLQGKHRPEYTPHIDTGDFVVVTNAKDVVVTGKKREQTMVVHYTGYPSGLREKPMGKVLDQRPDKILRDAVRRMLPKNKLARHMLTKLKIYAGPDHKHEAQQPQPIVVLKSKAV